MKREAIVNRRRPDGRERKREAEEVKGREHLITETSISLYLMLTISFPISILILFIYALDKKLKKKRRK